MSRAPWVSDPALREPEALHSVEQKGARPAKPTSDASGSLSAGERDEMTCDRCRRRHGVVWFAPSDVWNDVMREGVRANPDEFSFCCPLCFIQLAEERGIVTTGWLVTPFSDGPVRYASQIVLRAARSQAGPE